MSASVLRSSPSNHPAVHCKHKPHCSGDLVKEEASTVSPATTSHTPQITPSQDVGKPHKSKTKKRNKKKRKPAVVCLDTRDQCLKIINNNRIVKDKPLIQEFVRLPTRISTFSVWPKKRAQKPEALAIAGFYYTGSNDKVQCYHCEAIVDNWSRKDDVWKRHAVISPYCGHVRQCKGDEYIVTVLGHDNLLFDGSDVVTADEIVNSSTVASGGSVLTSGATSAAVSQSSSLAKSSLSIPVQEQGDDHSVQVFSFEGHCTNRHPKNMTTSEPELFREQFDCKICYEFPANTVILPCGHMASCSQCISSLTKCPICRSSIDGTVLAIMTTIR